MTDQVADTFGHIRWPSFISNLAMKLASKSRTVTYVMQSGASYLRHGSCIHNEMNLTS